MSRRGSKARIREFLRANVGRVVTSGQIREAAGLHVTEWARRLRELRNDEDWPIITHNDAGALKPGEYKLVSEPPAHAAYRFTRPISARVRAQALERNGYTCQMCGAGAGDDDDLNPARKVRLHIGHIVDHSHGGSDDLSNLRALCSTCNQGAKNVVQEPPSHAWLLSQLRRASVADQKAALDWLLGKFEPKEK